MRFIFKDSPLGPHLPPFQSLKDRLCQKPDVIPPLGPKEMGLTNASSDSVFQRRVPGVPYIRCLFVHSGTAGDTWGSAKRSKQAAAVTVTKQLVTVSGMEGRLKFMACHPGWRVGSEAGMR